MPAMGFYVQSLDNILYKLLCIRNGAVSPMSYAPCSFEVAQARLNHYRAVFPSYKYSLVKVQPGCD